MIRADRGEGCAQPPNGKAAPPFLTLSTLSMALGLGLAACCDEEPLLLG